MQNKTAIWLFTILMITACVSALVPTWLAGSFEGKAEAYAEAQRDSLSRVHPEMSTDSLQVFQQQVQEQFLVDHAADDAGMGISYEFVRDHKLNKGLDLQGGMNVTLEVSVAELIQALAGGKDDRLTKAIALASEKQNSQDGEFVELFGEAWEEVAPSSQLAILFQNRNNQEEIPREASNEEVIVKLAEIAEAAIDRTEQVLRRRIDNLGVVQPRITRLQGSGRIEVELPGIKQKSRVREILQATAKLEFWEIYEVKDLLDGFTQINSILAKENQIDEPETEKDSSAAVAAVATPDDTTGTAQEDEMSALDSLLDDGADPTANDLTSEDQAVKYSKENPLFSVMSPMLQRVGEGMNYIPGPVVARARAIDTAQVMAYLKREDLRVLIPGNPKFLWGVENVNDGGPEVFALYAMKMPDDGQPMLDGGAVTQARVEMDPISGRPTVSLNMNSKGAKTWKRMTENNVGKSVAITLDNVVYSAPVVQSVIDNGRTSISGQFDQEKAQDLANVLKAGKLPAPANIIAETVVGPTLGAQNISDGQMSFIIALALVLLYMIFYYNKAGVVANIALLVNMLLIFGVLAGLGSTLTLPGIAGIVLTIGMSVDANVLIYERIREEIAAQKGVRLAIEDGYKAAYSSILDANITTLLTGFILAWLGTGPIKGFAVTLIIGILTSLFCAIFITRLIFEWQLEKGGNVAFSTKLTEGLFKNLSISFIPRRKVFYAISGLIIVGGLASLMTNGLDLGIDFTGGRSYVVKFEEAIDVDQLGGSLSSFLGESQPEVRQHGVSNQYQITTKYMIDQTGGEAQDVVETALKQGLDAYGVGYDDISEGQLRGPAVAQDLRSSAIQAIIASLFIIFGYIAFRFKRWEFGIGALLAMFHDVLIVLAIFSIGYKFMPFSMEVGQAFIAALLTVVGYSINDTVVVFDRIREYIGLHKREDVAVVTNKALNSTLSRTINTSISTFVVLLMIFIAGGESIKGFVFALMIGVVVGTYSSLCIATPLALDLGKRRAAKAAKKK